MNINYRDIYKEILKFIYIGYYIYNKFLVWVEFGR